MSCAKNRHHVQTGISIHPQRFGLDRCLCLVADSVCGIISNGVVVGGVKLVLNDNRHYAADGACAAVSTYVCGCKRQIVLAMKVLLTRNCLLFLRSHIVFCLVCAPELCRVSKSEMALLQENCWSDMSLIRAINATALPRSVLDLIRC